MHGPAVRRAIRLAIMRGWGRRALANWSLIVVVLCDQSSSARFGNVGKIVRLWQAKIVRNATSRSKGRRGPMLRVRERLTEARNGQAATTRRCRRSPSKISGVDQSCSGLGFLARPLCSVLATQKAVSPPHALSRRAKGTPQRRQNKFA